MAATPDFIASCTIIIVDRMLIREAICIYSSKFKVLEFGGSDSFLAWVGSTMRREPILILMDINMPGRNGLETIKVFKRHQLFSKASIVAVNTSQEESQWVTC